MLERCAQGTLPNSIHQPARKAHRRFGGLGVGYHVLSMRISEFGSAGSRLAKLRRAAQRPYPFHWELGFAALVLLAWQLVRIPIEGDVADSVAHAHQILDLESRLSIDVEPSVIRLGSDPGLNRLLQWAYANLHVPVLFGFLAAARLRAPDRYPRLRTIYVLSFLPAFFVIWRYPTAPPRWIPEIGLGQAPSQAELSNTLGALVQNSTAAAASQHFGIALFVACGSLWAFPYSRLALATMAYPVFVFTVIVGTGNHYVLDCVVGAAAFGLATTAALPLHRRSRVVPLPATQTVDAAINSIGVASLAWAIFSLGSPATAFWTSTAPGLLALLFGLAVLSRPWNAASAFSSSEVGPA